MSNTMTDFLEHLGPGGRLSLDRIPSYMHEGLARYIMNGVIPGDFLCAVITNNLCKAVAHADSANSLLLAHYVAFFYNHAPQACWSSEKNMQQWSEQRGMRGSV